VNGDAYKALLIANSTYPNDAHNLPDLEGPRNDPALLRDALSDDRYGLFPSHSVRLVVERTMAEVLREAEEFLRSASRQDTVLLYYSGHGKLDLSGELYLCARDSRSDRLRSTAVKASDLSAMIEESAAATTVVLLDCCHSGAFKGAEIAQTLAGRGRFVVTSCRTGELANDAHALNRASMFTHHLVEGMLGQAPDHDADGLVGLDDLYGYVHARLAAENRQIPQRSFAGTGDVPLARRSQGALSDAAKLDTSEGAPEAQPVLDVSESVIALDGVGIDEELPPERVAVVNRGGGELRWSAECSADWVTLVRDEHGLLLHLRPGRGTNRANVHVRDDLTGMVRTVRLVVRTTESASAVPATDPQPAPTPPSSPSTASPEPRPAPAPESEPEEVQPAPSPIDEGSAAPARFGATVAAAALAGVWLAVSGTRFADDFARDEGSEIFLRDWDYGPGLGTSVLGGTILAAVAAVGLARLALGGRVRRPSWRLLLGLVLGLAAPLAIERTSMSFRWAPETWFFADRSVAFAVIPVLLGIAVVGLSAWALRADGAVVARGWAPPTLVRAGVLFALLWGAGSAIPVYDEYAYTRSYFDVIGANRAPVTVTMILLVTVLAAAVVVGGRRLSADAGRGVIAGAAVFLVAVETIEVLTLFGPSESQQGAGVLWMLVPAAAYVGTVVVMLRRSSTG